MRPACSEAFGEELNRNSTVQKRKSDTLNQMDDLRQAARQVRQRAYASYSGYTVGAALRDEQGRVHTGCNVENISYGLTLCAERAAIARMIAEGGKQVVEIAVATKDGGFPCGMCLQTLLEFSGEPAVLKIHTIDESGATQSCTLADLMPRGFCSDAVRKA
jgi:cytidine deaminase